jgi:hypothetical protein
MPKAYDKDRLDAIPTHPPDKALSGLNWEELKYLKDRGVLTESQERKAGFKPNPGVGGTFPPGQHVDVSGGVATVVDEEDEEPPEPEEASEGEGPYEDWSKSALQDEIDARNEALADEDRIPRTGTIPELAERLREDDEA